MKIIFGLLFVFCATSPAVAGEYYRSIDSSGKVHYGDSPLKGAPEVTKLKTQSESGSDGVLPFETQRAKEKFPVTLYVADSCGEACTRAQKFLTARGIPYTEKNLISDDDIASFRQSSGGEQIPAITVGDKWLKGFAENQWAKELDIAGYPKSAPYRAAVSSAPAVDKTIDE